MAADPKPNRRQEILDEIAERLNQRGVRGNCPLCGQIQWIVGAYAPLSASNSPAKLTLGGPVYPLISVFCGNCGNTHLVNLLTLGFTDDDWPRLTLPD
jgi:hypothetical protein